MAASESPAPSERQIAIPRTIDAVDAAWLTQALGVRHPGIEVKRAEILDSLGGACTKLRVSLQTNRKDFPPTVIVKGCLEPHSQSMAAPQLDEVKYYNLMVSQLKDVQTVQVLFAQGDEQRGAAMILEDLDLRGARCLKAMEPIADFELAARFIDEFAKLHARWWDAPAVHDGGEFNWIPQACPSSLGVCTARFVDADRRREILNSPRAAAIPRKLHDVDRLQRAFAAMFEASRDEPMVIAHGDAHLSNLFVDAREGAGLLDWTCFRAAWALDVTYFIAGSLDILDRRRWEKPLLQHYRERLRAYGVTPPAFEQVWLAYRRWHMWGVIVWLTNIPEYHTESMITAMASRFATATCDHNSLELLAQ